MSKILSYANLTAHTEQTLRPHLADAAVHREAGHDTRAHEAWVCACTVHRMWEGLAVQYLEPHRRKSFMADFARLDALMYPEDAAPAPLPTSTESGHAQGL
ncbi:hypothetical protein [Paraburkholderia sp. J63]|uniref:hypothetical protein n=1 Tax=Paraburkholderia sp. J63 TaxID=2805434 RepID=UPI002ABE6710|nr:hypothetical protein [Paraburkholderia sp. J63]